jgi:hypothetical protein
MHRRGVLFGERGSNCCDMLVRLYLFIVFSSIRFIFLMLGILSRILRVLLMFFIRMFRRVIVLLY